MIKNILLDQLGERPQLFQRKPADVAALLRRKANGGADDMVRVAEGQALADEVIRKIGDGRETLRCRRTAGFAIDADVRARRGLVIGILSASTATGQLIFLPGLAFMTQHHGWRITVSAGVYDSWRILLCSRDYGYLHSKKLAIGSQTGLVNATKDMNWADVGEDVVEVRSQFIQKVIFDLEKRFGDMAPETVAFTTHLPYIQDEYDSDDHELSIEGCLDHAKIRIMAQYFVRAPYKNNLTFNQFWTDVCDVQGRASPDNQASTWAERVEVSPIDGPEAYAALFCAGVYWCDALKEIDAKDKDRAWAALLRCNYFIGMACGPKSASDVQSAGNEASNKQKNKFRNELRVVFQNWLERQKDGSIESISKMIASFITEEANAYVASFKEKNKGKWYPGNLNSFIRAWWNDDEDDLSGLMARKKRERAKNS